MKARSIQQFAIVQSDSATAFEEELNARLEDRIMLQKIEFFIMCIGGMMADSDCLLVPIGVATLGAFLIWVGDRKEADDETA